MPISVSVPVPRLGLMPTETTCRPVIVTFASDFS